LHLPHIQSLLEKEKIMQPKESFNLGRFVNFDELITGRFLKILYLAGSALILLGAVGMGGLTAITGFFVALQQASPAGVFASLFWFVLILVGGFVWLILWRVYCEIIMIFFKINENLQAIRDLNIPPLK
jgi:hypothetical protein